MLLIPADNTNMGKKKKKRKRFSKMKHCVQQVYNLPDYVGLQAANYLLDQTQLREKNNSGNWLQVHTTFL